jgi:hypothetical protein
VVPAAEHRETTMSLSTAPITTPSTTPKTATRWRPALLQRCARVAVALTFAVSGVFVAAAPAHAGWVSVPIFELWPRHTLINGGHMCVDVANANLAHATQIVQANCWGGANQRFWFQGRNDGSFLIHPVHSHKCLDVAYMSTQHGASILQADCRDTDNQRWFEAGSNGIFRYHPKHSLNGGKLMCMDVANQSLAHGTWVVQGTCWGGLNQQFVKVQVGVIDVFM